MFFATFIGYSDDVVIYVGDKAACVAACHTLHDSIASTHVVRALAPYLMYDVGAGYVETRVTEVGDDGRPMPGSTIVVTRNPQEE